MKKVVLLGPESTGKTTLAERLAYFFETTWVPEFVREFAIEKGKPIELSDLPAIVSGQIASEERQLPLANRILICDTNPLMSVVYSRWYFGTCPPEVESVAKDRFYDLYLLHDVDIPWVKDNQRDMPHRREELRDRCQNILEALGCSYVWIRGDRNTRFEIAAGAIQNLLS